LRTGPEDVHPGNQLTQLRHKNYHL
jgi:hypothetical protein